VIRKDLPVEVQVVQGAHAALESGLHLGDDKTRVNHLVALQVKNEEQLRNVHERLRMCGVESVLFEEPDRGNEATALCSGPVEGDARKLFSRYNLWQEGAAK